VADYPPSPGSPVTAPLIAPLGDRALTITFGTTIDEPTHRRVRAAAARLRQQPPPGMIDLVPAFASITLHYAPERIAVAAHGAVQRAGASPFDRLRSIVQQTLIDATDDDAAEARLVEIPVCYGGDLGPDLDDVAARHAMAPDDVVAAHAAAEYRVYMIGFMPGFAYLGGLPPHLATPRRSAPRMAVPAGAVGIGGSQTGVYPLIAPGGWNLIGRTPLTMFDAARAEPSLLAGGDRVRFHAIDRATFDGWRT
jgi:inhibitor of KinA